MELDRRKLDDLAFVAALGAIGFAGFAFATRANGAAVVMCGICFAGLVAGRLFGISGFSLLPLAIGLVFILWIGWIDPLSTPRRTSAFSHGTGGFLVGWALAITLRRRGPWPEWALIAIGLVAALTIGWEVCEYIGDRLLDTALIPGGRDSAEDILFGAVGGSFAVCLVSLFPRSRA